MLDIFIQHWPSWLIVLGLLLGLVHIARIIKNEESTLEENYQVFEIGKFQIKVPIWWSDSLKKSSTQTITFERTDTIYEWFAEFNWLKKDSLKGKNLDDFLREQIEQDQIEFDPHETTLTDKSFYPNAENLQKNKLIVYRIEGTATQKKMQRCYIDVYVIENIVSGEILYAKSWSSILNGMLEGPYFEKVFLELIGQKS